MYKELIVKKSVIDVKNEKEEIENEFESIDYWFFYFNALL